MTVSAIFSSGPRSKPEFAFTLRRSQARVDRYKSKDRRTLEGERAALVADLRAKGHEVTER